MINAVKQRFKILVVDDDSSVRSMFRSLLEFDAHEVQTAANAEAALLMLEQSRFDVIITDYLMPGMSGDEFAALVKQRWPEQAIIMASGSYSNCTVVGNKALCVDYFLSKPFLMDELRDAIACVMEHGSEKTDDGRGTPWTPGFHAAKPDADVRQMDGRCDL